MTPKCSIVVALLSLVLLQANHVTADFGLPTTVIGGSTISSNANSINSVLNSLNQNLRRFNPGNQSKRLGPTSEKITQMAQTISDLGKLVATNVSKAALDRSTPVKELFSALQGSYEQMNQYLKSDALASMDSMNDNLGNSFTTQLENALDGVTKAIGNMTTITETFEQAIGETLQAANGAPLTRGTVTTHIPPGLTISMSKALVEMKEQTTMLSKVIENVLKSIAFVDSYLVKVNATALSMEQRVNATYLGMSQQYLTEANTIIKRYYTSQNSVKSELVNVIGRLSVFRTNRTLLALVDGFSEAYTKIYYYLYHRNQTDVDTILRDYNAIISNLDQYVQALNDNLTSEMQQTAARVGFQYLSQNANYDICFNKHQTQFFMALTNINNGIINCLGREKNRMGRLPDVVDRMLRQTEANTEDFGYNIGTCVAHIGFASSLTTYNQAVACLNTTLNHTESFQQALGPVYDAVLQMCNMEVTSSSFRIGDCLETRGNESFALIESLNVEVEQCLNGESTRSYFADPEEQVIELTFADEAEGVTEEESAMETATGGDAREDNFFDDLPEDVLGNY